MATSSTRKVRKLKSWGNNVTVCNNSNEAIRRTNSFSNTALLPQSQLLHWFIKNAALILKIQMGFPETPRTPLSSGDSIDISYIVRQLRVTWGTGLNHYYIHDKWVNIAT